MKLEPVYQITTYVPPKDLNGLIQGILKVVPLRYGDYDQVLWWSAPGTEQFRPLEGSNPSVGQTHVVEQVSSVKLEFTLAKDPDLLTKVVREGIIPHHPWEEPVIYINEVLAPRASQ